MRRVFADSHYFFALVSEDDEHHRKAVNFADSFRGKVLTTNWVITEVADGLARPAWRASFVALHRELTRSRDITIEPFSQSLQNEGIELYSARRDKSWSLTDCISFVVMQRENIAEALTGDHDFEQAGFIALLK